VIDFLNPKDIHDLVAKKEKADEEHLYRKEKRRHYGEKFRGSGVENVVMQHNKDSVLALRIEHAKDPDWHRKLFRIHKIFHNLFPEHFPHFRTVMQLPKHKHEPSATNKVVKMSVRQDIGSHTPTEPRSLRKVFDFLAVIGMKQTREDDFIDFMGDNFQLASDGNAYYVDELSSEFFGQFVSKRNEVLEYMNSQQYAPAAIQSVKTSFDVLEKMK
jgi:hypothetical protein